MSEDKVEYQAGEAAPDPKVTPEDRAWIRRVVGATPEGSVDVGRKLLLALLTALDTAERDVERLRTKNHEMAHALLTDLTAADLSIEPGEHVRALEGALVAALDSAWAGHNIINYLHEAGYPVEPSLNLFRNQLDSLEALPAVQTYRLAQAAALAAQPADAAPQQEVG